MNNLDKKHIEIFREYFLSQNEDVRRSIRNILPGVLLKYLSIIEAGFSQKTTVENIASQIEATHLIPDLKQLQTDYFLSLEQIFEKEVAFAIRATERAAFKKKFESIDLADEIQDSEIKEAISQVERESVKLKFEEIEEWEQSERFISAIANHNISEQSAEKIAASKVPPPIPVVSFNRIVRYAAAAVVVGIVFLGGYFIINNNKEKNNGGLARNENKKDSIKTEVTTNLSTITEHISELQLLVPETFGFAKEKPEFFAIVTLNIEKQIDTLKKIYSDEIQGRNGAGVGPIAKVISRQIDSLLSIRSTYTYDVGNRKIVVRLGNGQKVDKVISTDPSLKTNLFIKINKDYYHLKPTMQPLKLTPVKNKSTIEELEKIIFQNS